MILRGHKQIFSLLQIVLPYNLFLQFSTGLPELHRIQTKLNTFVQPSPVATHPDKYGGVYDHRPETRELYRNGDV
jgi:hypothetical protein